jgi:shikimate kinase
MVNKNVILIGFMGSGKSMTASRLSKILGRKVISTDKLIEKREGRSISKIFDESGESYFRKVERKIVAEVSRQTGVILDCGGGVVLDAENRVNLKKNGILIYLSASPDSIYKNIKNRAHRPLLNVKDPRARIAKLLEERKPLYEQADVVIDADHKSIDQITEEVLKVLQK